MYQRAYRRGYYILVITYYLLHITYYILVIHVSSCVSAWLLNNSYYILVITYDLLHISYTCIVVRIGMRAGMHIDTRVRCRHPHRHVVCGDTPSWR